MKKILIAMKTKLNCMSWQVKTSGDSEDASGTVVTWGLAVKGLKDPSQPPPFSMSSKLLKQNLIALLYKLCSWKFVYYFLVVSWLFPSFRHTPDKQY